MGALPQQVGINSVPQMHRAFHRFAEAVFQGPHAVASTPVMEVSGNCTGGRVVLASGAAVEYDWLVLALGSDSVFFGIPGVKEHCLPFCSYNDAVRVSPLPSTIPDLPLPALVSGPRLGVPAPRELRAPTSASGVNWCGGAAHLLRFLLSWRMGSDGEAAGAAGAAAGPCGRGGGGRGLRRH